MREINFPIFKTKIDKDNSPSPKASEGQRKFDLTDANQRKEYFNYKTGQEIKKLKKYLKTNTFVVYLLGKKNSGKGTYSKMFKEIVAPDKVEHFSIGDMIRSFDQVIKNKKKKEDLIEFLHKNYRGPVSVKDIVALLEGRSTKNLLPSELILVLTEREISKLGKKAIFIDGFPRDLDQVSYSLFFRDLIGYRDDPDIFVLIDVPMNVIDERIKYRVICPVCQTARNLKLLPTKNIEYDKKSRKFYLICDNLECLSVKACKASRMVTKEGDELGIKPIKERLEKDDNLMKQVYKMHGISIVLLRNSIPVKSAKEFYDDYEITPEYSYLFDKKNNKIRIKEKPWQINDDEGIISKSLMPPPVVVSLIKQLVKTLGI